MVRDSLSEIEWENGSRLFSLPDSGRGVVGFTPSMIVIDEASRVSDTLYRSVRPMMALGNAEMVTLSTPFGKRGWFFDIWATPQRKRKWATWRVTANQVNRIDAEFLEDEREELGERWYRQEYECSFEEAIDAVFQQEDIDDAFKTDAKPLFEMGA